MIYTDVFCRTAEAVTKTDRFVSSCGGTRSGKTISILQFLFLLVSQDKTATINSVVSETMPHLKRGAIRDFQTCIDLYDETCWSRGTSTYTFPSGAIIEFFSADSPAKVHGPARDRLFLNECQNIDWEIARQLFVRTRGKIFLDYNPTHQFWVNDRVETRDNCVTIHSTFLDNKDYKTGESTLSAEQIAEIESNKNDTNWWRIYGLGLVGQLEGLIFPDFEQCDTMPERTDGMVESYGLDFGFTNDPSTLVHCLTDTRKKEIWADECFYRTGMLNADMANEMKRLQVGRGIPVYADCAEPKTIQDLHGYGFNVLPCQKAVKKAEQLQQMKGYRLKVTKRSLNLIRELRGYTWARDKDGQWLNEPIGILDHSIDALRYGCFPYLRTLQGSQSRFESMRI